MLGEIHAKTGDSALKLETPGQSDLVGNPTKEAIVYGVCVGF